LKKYGKEIVMKDLKHTMKVQKFLCHQPEPCTFPIIISLTSISASSLPYLLVYSFDEERLKDAFPFKSCDL